eukprot:243183_1
MSRDTRSLLIFGYLNNESKHNKIDIPSSIQELVSLFYGKALDGTLIIKPNETVTLQSDKDRQYEFESVIIHKKGKLTVNTYDKKTEKGGVLKMKVWQNVVLHEGACIDLTGCGYEGGKPGPVDSDGYVTLDKGDGPGGGNTAGHVSRASNVGHGAYASNGFDGSDRCLCGRIYGDPYLSTLHMGSGGGGFISMTTRNFSWGRGTKSGSCQGTRGGGALKIDCNEIIFNKGAYICCDGGRPQYSLQGCGSGGSIHLKVWGVMGPVTVLARGGKAYEHNYGGCGRIRLEMMDMTEVDLSGCFEDVESYKLWMSESFDPMPYIG